MEHRSQVAYSTCGWLSSYPSKQWPGTSLLNFVDLAGTGVSTHIDSMYLPNPLATARHKVNF